MSACVALIRLWTIQQVLMEGLTKVITTLSQSVAEKGQEVENQAQQIADLRTSVQVRGVTKMQTFLLLFIFSSFFCTCRRDF